jgi:hypothetical protein
MNYKSYEKIISRKNYQMLIDSDVHLPRTDQHYKQIIRELESELKRYVYKAVKCGRSRSYNDVIDILNDVIFYFKTPDKGYHYVPRNMQYPNFI